MKSAIALITIVLAASLTNVHAQTKDEKEYRKESEEMRQQVWAWDQPAFKRRDIPAEYANASKVIIAHHTELTAASKSKFKFYVVTFGVKKEETITEVTREMVKVNDKAAVDDYSELTFTRFQKTSGFFYDAKTTVYVGARVIKPNGSVKEINADDIVLTKDESKEKQAKLAIPDLQPGDIIDYFIASVKLVANDFSTKPYLMLLFDDAPVLSYSFHGQLGKKFAIAYHSYNGAPDLQVSKNDDDDIVIDLNKKDIPPFETSLWVAPARQLPFIQMNISLGYRGPGARSISANKPGEINKITVSDDALNGKVGDLAIDYYNNYWMKAARKQYDAIVDDAEKMAKQMNERFKDLSDKDKAALLFYTFRFTQLLNFDIDMLSKKINIGDYSFNQNAINLYCLLKDADIDGTVMVGGYRQGVKMNEAMNSDDIGSVAYMPGTKSYLNLQSVYDIPFTTPWELEGATDTKLVAFTNKMTGAKSDIDAGPAVPVSTSDKNAHIENMQLSLSPDNNNLIVHRSTTLKGFYKTDAQRQLILYEDFYEEERKAFHEDKSLIESLEDSKKSRKYVDEVKNAFAEARKKQKDDFTDEAKDWFNQDITDLRDYRTDTLGVRNDAPDFVYSSTFNMNGLVKKAGNNIILEIGKMEGDPLIIKPDQRKRNLDVYMDYARSIEYNINFTIPDGYTVQGVDALNKNVSNETGFFSAEAAVNGNMLTIKLKKHYLHNFEPVANFDKIIQFTDAAGDWVNSKILLKKGS